jgi:hypothetical protein
LLLLLLLPSSVVVVKWMDGRGERDNSVVVVKWMMDGRGEPVSLHGWMDEVNMRVRSRLSPNDSKNGRMTPILEKQ